MFEEIRCFSLKNGRSEESRAGQLLDASILQRSNEDGWDRVGRAATRRHPAPLPHDFLSIPRPLPEFRALRGTRRAGVGLPKPTAAGDEKLHILDQKFPARELPHLNERLPFRSQLIYGDNNISKHIPVSSRRHKKLQAVVVVLLCSVSHRHGWNFPSAEVSFGLILLHGRPALRQQLVLVYPVGLTVRETRAEVPASRLSPLYRPTEFERVRERKEISAQRP